MVSMWERSDITQYPSISENWQMVLVEAPSSHGLTISLGWFFVCSVHLESSMQVLCLSLPSDQNVPHQERSHRTVLKPRESCFRHAMCWFAAITSDTAASIERRGRPFGGAMPVQIQTRGWDFPVLCQTCLHEASRVVSSGMALEAMASRHGFLLSAACHP